MKLRISIIFSFVILFIFGANLYAQSAQDLIGQGDKACAEFKNQIALDKFLAADKLSPNNWEIAWRISRSYVDIGEHVYGEVAQIDNFNKALAYADQAIRLAPDKSIVYLRRAITNGKIALSKGIFSVGGVVTAVKDDVTKAIQLGNGGNEVQSVCHYVLARTHAKLAETASWKRWPLGLGWGDNKVALAEFPIAISLRPDFRMYYYDYAKALCEEGDYNKAKEMLGKINNISVKDEDDYTVANDAAKLLNDIKNK